MSHLEINEIVLNHYNILNNNIQHNSSAFYEFVPSKCFLFVLNNIYFIFQFSKTQYQLQKTQ